MSNILGWSKNFVDIFVPVRPFGFVDVFFALHIVGNWSIFDGQLIDFIACTLHSLDTYFPSSFTSLGLLVDHD